MDYVCEDCGPDSLMLITARLSANIFTRLGVNHRKISNPLSAATRLRFGQIVEPDGQYAHNYDHRCTIQDTTGREVT